jgi:hypothetical protein
VIAAESETVSTRMSANDADAVEQHDSGHQ